MSSHPHPTDHLSSSAADAPAQHPAAAGPPSPVLLLALSGPSSSGKTTLARLLRDILPHAYILHLDDFYKPDAAIPVSAAGVQDWDCLGAIDVPALRSALSHMRAHGAPPPDFVSKEDLNAVGECGIAADAVEACAERVRRSGVAERLGSRRVAIVDGFLLYSEEMAALGIRDLFDVKLFLRTSYGAAKRRREARAGYVTIEGFWEDPPGYVDEVVWPNYVKDHAFLFEGGDVEGEVDGRVCERVGVQVMPKDAAEDMGKVLDWATGVIVDELGKVTQS